MTPEEENELRHIISKLDHMILEIEDFIHAMKYGEQPDLCDDVCPDGDDIR